MTCDDCLLLMEEDLDAELDGRGAGFLASHLATCSSCTQEYQTLKREREIYTRYSRDIAFTPALWTAVRTRIEENLKPRPISFWGRIRHWAKKLAVMPRLTPVLAASLVVVVIVSTLLLTKSIILRQNPAKPGVGSQEAKSSTSHPSQAPSPSSGSMPAKVTAELKSQQAQPEGALILKSQREVETNSSPAKKNALVAHRVKRAPTVQELVAQAEQKYLAAIAILSRDLKNPHTKLDPVLRARLEVTLAAIDRTIADTREAVGQRPTDPEAVRYMLTAYAKKVEVLQEMASY
jgi:hypothetical protein